MTSGCGLLKRIRRLRNNNAHIIVPTYMPTPIIPRDLTTQAPHSPRQRVAGFVIATRAVDKCLATLAGKAGDYHFDCPLDNLLFSFKGVTGEQFKTAVKAAEKL